MDKIPNAISQRISKYSFFDRLQDHLVVSVLTKRAPRLNAERGMPIAIFGNDHIGFNISLNGVYEKEHLADLDQLLCTMDVDPTNFTAIDIGSNIGNHAIYFARNFKKVICFEPNPRTYEILTANVKELKNVEIHNVGCGSKAQLLKLWEDSSNIGSSSVVKELDSENSFEISIKPLDEMHDYLSEVGLIKIDVEGMEVECLKGAERVITEYRPLICLEQHLQDFSGEFYETEAIDWLRGKGYRIFALLQHKRKSFIWRWLNYTKQFAFGIVEKRTIVEFDKLPKGVYSMVYAIHTAL